jgi:elongation factor G
MCAQVEITVPEEYQSAAMGDINKRKGLIVESDTNDNLAVIVAEVPLYSMFGYSTDLRTLTSGKGEFSMEYSHYARAAPQLQEELVREMEKERKTKK